MSYPFLIIFALSPSLIWLLFYLRKDKHPESNSMVLKIFFYGMLSAIPAIFVELGFFHELGKLNLSSYLASFLNVFIGVALTEELLKYSIVKIKVTNSSELDEPVDVMLYMIIAALGFAALENLLIFLSSETYFLEFGETLTLAIFRFISATFLHALTSGTLGYFMAVDFFKAKKRSIFLFLGFLIVTMLHGLYNFYIIIGEGYSKLIVPTIIIIGLAIFVSQSFKKLKKMASVCKV